VRSNTTEVVFSLCDFLCDTVACSGNPDKNRKKSARAFIYAGLRMIDDLQQNGKNR